MGDRYAKAVGTQGRNRTSIWHRHSRANCTKIIADIQSGRFTPGVALPGTRDLASKIQVNRKTVIQAYDELIAQGWLTSEHKRGTFVSSRVLAVNHRSHKTQAPVPHPTYQAKHELTHKNRLY